MDISVSDIKVFDFLPPNSVSITLKSNKKFKINIKVWMVANNIPEPGKQGFMPLAKSADGIDWGHPHLSVAYMVILFNEQFAEPAGG